MLPKAPQITVGGLDSILAEVEPILREVGGNFGFTHPSVQEVLIAKQFADEINSGALSVKDAYEQFWIYVEEGKSWHYPRELRVLLPAWKSILYYLPDLLHDGLAEEFIEIVAKSYLDYENQFRFKDPLSYYNPAESDFCFCINTMKHSARLNGSNTHETMENTYIQWMRRVIPLIKEDQNYKQMSMVGDIWGDELFNLYVNIEKLQSPEIIDKMLGYLFDETSPDREFTIITLKNVGDKRVINPLRFIMEMEPYLRIISYEAVKQIYSRCQPKGYIAPERLQRAD